jgi:hypothetical protein
VVLVVLAIAGMAFAGTAVAQEQVPPEDAEGVELLAETGIDNEHACLHGDFDDRTPLTGGSSVEDAPTVDETHDVWNVTYDGDGGYVNFDAEAHDHDGPFVFYTDSGTADPVNEEVLERGEVPNCDGLEEYVKVGFPQDGTNSLLLTEGGHGGDEEDGGVSTFEIDNHQTGEVIASVHGDHWHGSTPEIEKGGFMPVGANIEDADGNEIDLSDDHHSIDARLAEGADEGVVSLDGHGDHVRVDGDEEGSVGVVFQLLHDGNVEYETPSIEVEVINAAGPLSDDNPFGDQNNNPVSVGDAANALFEWNTNNGVIDGQSYTESELANFLFQWNMARSS